MNSERSSSESAGTLGRALEVLAAGGLVAFPTDTVYGVGADVFDDLAAQRLYEVKGRPERKAIPVLLPGVEALPMVVEKVDARARRLAQAFWPGPLTIVLPKAQGIPMAVTALETVGVRVPDHPVALSLLAAAGPLAVTSANLSDAENSLTAADVERQLGGKIELIVDGGRCPGGQPSTVVSLDGEDLKILRPGPLTLEVLEAALG
ncbi:MAG: L-threonylcarbamoyladenylate synthase [Anaerolineales bacterium]